MKKLSIFFVIFLPIYCIGQVTESFSDGNFTQNPVWTGHVDNFTVNSSFQLQSKATSTSNSFLFTPSEAFDDATWECWVKIAYNPSSSNYASIYIASDKSDIANGCNGYYVQIGGTNDEVSLFVQEGTKKTKIIDGLDKRTDKNLVELRIRVTRDAQGNFSLYSKLDPETDFMLEGTATNNVVKKSAFFGLFYANSSLTGNAYYFDDIVVTGNKAVDLVSPEWKSLALLQPDKLLLRFSEEVDPSVATFNLDNGIGLPVSHQLSEDKTTLELVFDTDFEKGKVYTLEIIGLTDLAGNPLTNPVKSVGIAEKIEPGDLILNEIMFENPENSLEYIEIYNTSDKVLDVSGLVFTTRKTDQTLNTGNNIPSETLLLPRGYMALSADASMVRNYHNCPAQSDLITTTWTTLNNESSTVVLCNAAKDTVYDELTYSSKWHHVLIKSPKGVALERIHPDLPTHQAASWHSAASEVGYGTPGYQNSQYREITSENPDAQLVWLDTEVFSPDNDGVDDVCFIHYKTDEPGSIANIIIFNSVGLKMLQLTSNALLSGEGFFTWDGRTDSGKNANSGIYVIYFEVFNPNTGNRKQIKLPIVVSCR